MNTVPKNASLFSLFLRLGGWIVLAMGIMILILGLHGANQLSLAKAFEERGVVTVATIVDKRKRVSSDADRDRKTTYYVTYRYKVKSGRFYRKEMSVSA